MGGRAAANAITPPGPRCSRPCRSAVRRGLPPEPDRSLHLWRARGWGLPAAAGTGGSPERSPGPGIIRTGGQSQRCRVEASGRGAVKLSRAPAGTGECWQAAPPKALPASAARGDSQPAACVASFGSAGFGPVSSCNVPLLFVLRAESL